MLLASGEALNAAEVPDLRRQDIEVRGLCQGNILMSGVHAEKFK